MADLYTRILLLSKSTVFSGVYTEDLRVLAQELDEEACFAGERIFDISEPSDSMYLIASGKIGISVQKDPKIKEFHSTLGAGECFGEMGVIDGLPRSATAHVLEDSNLLVLDKVKLRALVLRYPELGLGMMKSLSMRLRHTTSQL